MKNLLFFFGFSYNFWVIFGVYSGNYGYFVGNFYEKAFFYLKA